MPMNDRPQPPANRWQITVTVETALCIGDSGGRDALLDKTTVKDRDGNLYIPASTFKGIWRHACEAIARGLGEYVCGSPRAENMCPKPGTPDDYCIVCELFGSPRKPSSLLVSDLRLTADMHQTVIRNGVTINRNLRTAEEKRLFFVETSQHNAALPFIGYVTLLENLTGEQTQLLRAGLKYIHAVGSGKSTGLGWISVDLSDTAAQEGTPVTVIPADECLTEIEIQVELHSPLVIGGRKPVGAANESLDYIRGGLLRGALAETYLRQIEGSPAENDVFRRLFLGPKAAVFRNCYSASEGGSPRVLPATAVSCKARSGFIGSSEDSGHHGVFDTLLERLAAENANWPYHPTCPFCDGDGGRVEAFGGVYSSHDTIYQREKLGKRLLTRVAINRQRKAAEDELLYHLLAIDPIRDRSEDKHGQPKRGKPAVMLGSARVPSELVEDVCDRLQNHACRLGNGGSRGLGQVSITADIRPKQTPLADRVQTFNTAMRKIWETYRHLSSANHQPLDMTYFTINLQSDVLLMTEDGWQRTMVLTAGMLQEMANCQAPLELVRSFASYDYVSGWNAAWGLRKDTELATRMGSLFVFRTSEMDTWYEPLRHLEAIGIGHRREEGFGQILVCEPFHLRTRSELEKQWRKGNGTDSAGE